MVELNSLTVGASTATGLLADVDFGFELSARFRLVVGGTNIFDAMPTEQDPNETENGARWENIQMGFNGAGYFARLAYKVRGK